MLRRFASAVEDVEPSAARGPTSILESGRTVIRAAIEAGGWALVSIGLLLWVVLRRFTDVLLLPVSGREEPLMHRFIARENYAAPTTTWIGDT